MARFRYSVRPLYFFLVLTIVIRVSSICFNGIETSGEGIEKNDRLLVKFPSSYPQYSNYLNERKKRD